LSGGGGGVVGDPWEQSFECNRKKKKCHQKRKGPGKIHGRDIRTKNDNGKKLKGANGGKKGKPEKRKGVLKSFLRRKWGRGERFWRA